MTAQGFEYTPVDPFAQQQALTGKARLSEEEFIEQFGYGISTLFGRATEQADPNERIRRSLAATDRAAYDRALWGDNRGATFADAVDSGHFGAARRVHEGGERGHLRRRAGADRARRASSTSSTGTSSRTSAWCAPNEKWSACMAQRGFRYADPGDIEGDIEQRFTAIVGVGVRPGATAPPDPGTSYDRAALAELRQRRGERRQRRPGVREAGDHTGRAGRPAAVRGGLPQAEPHGCSCGSSRSAE